MQTKKTQASRRPPAVCNWCGRVYAARPFLCECQSNAFLQNLSPAEYRELAQQRGVCLPPPFQREL